MIMPVDEIARFARTDIQTPIGPMLALARDGFLSGLWFHDQKHFPAFSAEPTQDPEAEPFPETRSQLIAYFERRLHRFDLPLAPVGTDFQRAVWAELRNIPFGQTATYGELAARLTGKNLARAVGGTVSRNPISIIIPCHRVIGSDGAITGYAGGLDRKRWLLTLET